MLTLVISFLIGGSAWLMIGSRLNLNENKDVNEALNLITYVSVALIPVFLCVFYLLDRH